MDESDRKFRGICAAQRNCFTRQMLAIGSCGGLN
jgi:hypothetical protein